MHGSLLGAVTPGEEQRMTGFVQRVGGAVAACEGVGAHKVGQLTHKTTGPFQCCADIISTPHPPSPQPHLPHTHTYTYSESYCSIKLEIECHWNE